MKVSTLSIALYGFLGLSCGPTETAAPAPDLREEAREEARQRSARRAQHGGNLVVAGDHPVEVVLHASGEVYGYLLSSPRGSEQAALAVEVPVANRPAQRLALGWSSQLRRHEGRLSEVIVPGPLVVHLTVGGEVSIGRLPRIVVAPAIVTVEERPPEKPKKRRRRRAD